jgi:hypothetical protein
MEDKDATPQSELTDVPQAEPAIALPPAEEPVTSEAAPKRRHRLSKKWLLLLFVLVLNVGVGSANVYLALQPETADAASSSVADGSSAATSQKTAVDTKPGTDVKTLHYVSKPLNLEFDYPVDWRISGSNDNQQLSMSSPPFQFTDTDGKSAAVTLQLNISAASPTNYGFIGDTDVVKADSEPISYSHPTSNQRQQTNLSFTEYSTSSADAIAFLLVTGSYSYHKGDVIGSHDYKKVDPQITMYVDECYAVHCQGLNVGTFDIATFHSDSHMQDAKAIIESLRLN